MKQMIRTFQDEHETKVFARELAHYFLEHSEIEAKIYLHGELGAGKTTFARHFIHGLGVKGAIKSPTYTLIEPYQTEVGELLHSDLYRLASPLELYDLGLLEEEGIWLVEWPEKGAGVLPEPDLRLNLVRTGESLNVEIQAESGQGLEILNFLKQKIGTVSGDEEHPVDRSDTE